MSSVSLPSAEVLALVTVDGGAVALLDSETASVGGISVDAGCVEGTSVDGSSPRSRDGESCDASTAIAAAATAQVAPTSSQEALRLEACVCAWEWSDVDAFSDVPRCS